MLSPATALRKAQLRATRTSWGPSASPSAAIPIPNRIPALKRASSSRPLAGPSPSSRGAAGEGRPRLEPAVSSTGAGRDERRQACGLPPLVSQKMSANSFTSAWSWAAAAASTLCLHAPACFRIRQVRS